MGFGGERKGGAAAFGYSAVLGVPTALSARCPATHACAGALSLLSTFFFYYKPRGGRLM